jgi:hypothetical protein
VIVCFHHQVFQLGHSLAKKRSESTTILKVEEIMNVEDLKAYANQLKTELLNKLGSLQQILAKARKDYSKAGDFETFIKTFYKEELLDQPERIPIVAMSIWMLLLIFHWKFWIFFVFGILPMVFYYLLKVFKKAPASEY